MFDWIDRTWDQLNPLSTSSLIIFFAWIVIYVFTAATIWRAGNRWVRLLAFIVNQVFSIGIFISTINVVVAAVIYPWYAGGTALGTAVLAWLVFRRRPADKRAKAKAHKAGKAEAQQIADKKRHREGQDITGDDLGRLTDDWLSGNLPAEGDDPRRRS